MNQYYTTKKTNTKIYTRLIEPRDFEQVKDIANWAFIGKQNCSDGWTTTSSMVEGIRLCDDDLNKYLSMPREEWSIFVAEKIDEKDGASDSENHSGEILGCVQVERDSADSDTTEIGMLVVDPRYQSDGIGYILMKAMHEYVKSEWGLKKATITVVTGRLELYKWYSEKFGYVEGETEPFVYPNLTPKDGKVLGLTHFSTTL
eukprot:gene3311-4150_t